MDKKESLKQISGILAIIMVGTIIIGTTAGWAWGKKAHSQKATALPGGWVGTDWTGTGKASSKVPSTICKPTSIKRLLPSLSMAR